MSSQPRIPDFSLARRRSQRVVMQVPIRVRGEDAGGRAFDEETETLAINSHGAFILLQGRVSRGAQITLKHNRTGEEQECRVLHVGPLRGNKAEIGLEFSSPRAHFWRVYFPPEDWTPKSLEARKPVIPRNEKEKSSVPSAGLPEKS
jgi:PilZ domain